MLKDILKENKLVLKEANFGSHTNKLIRDLFNEKLVLTRKNMLLILDKFLSKFDNVNEYKIFLNKYNNNNLSAFNILAKKIYSETNINLEKVKNTLDTFLAHTDNDFVKFRNIKNEFNKGIFSNWIAKNIK